MNSETLMKICLNTTEEEFFEFLSLWVQMNKLEEQLKRFVKE